MKTPKLLLASCLLSMLAGVSAASDPTGADAPVNGQVQNVSQVGPSMESSIGGLTHAGSELWFSVGTTKLYRMPDNGTGLVLWGTQPGNLGGQLRGVDSDGTHIYGATNVRDRIMRWEINGSGFTEFSSSSSLPNPVDVAVDATHVYAADTNVGLRRVVKGSGLFSSFGGGPSGISSVTVDDTYVYFSNGTSVYRVNKATGSGLTTIFSGGVAFAGGLDAANGRLYITSPTQGVLSMAPDGSDVQVHAQAGQFASAPGAIVVQGTSIFVVVGNTIQQVSTTLEDTALQFDGNDRALVNAASAPNLGTSFTIEAWVQVDNTSQHHTILDIDNKFDVLILSGGRLEINAATGSAVTGSGLISAGTWHHVAVVADAAAGQTRFYVDGVLRHTASNYNPYTTYSGDLNIGARDPSRATQVYLRGLLDELRIWNSARTQQQIADQRFTEQTELPRPADLVAYYPIGTQSRVGSTLDDWHGSADGTIGGATRVSPGAPLAAPSIDTDGDGVDDDNDAFPNDPNEWADSDGDGVGDNSDAFPNDPNEWADSDGDGVGDNSDAFPNDPNEWADSDGDGVGDNSDAFPNDPNEWADADGDGVGDNSDAFPNDPTETTDSDGDGVGDNSDAFPNDPNEWADSDGDGVGDNSDAFPNDPNEWADSDGDGVGDNSDAFPNDPTETTDSDGDGVGDNSDAFPDDPNEWADSDGDGVGDNSDVFPNDPNEWADSDGDGVGDNSDAFPNDPNEWADSDGDGVGDNSDAFPNDPTETTDSDGDGVGDNSDVFPNDPNEWADSDGDGVGDNSDAFPNDPNEWADSDGDGVGDNSDPFPNDPNESVDSDGDGVGDNSDAFPDDPNEWADSDGDGVGDNSDAFPNDPNEWADSDGDGVGDNSDAFPNDPNEWADSDGDGVGDNSDAFPNDPNEWADSDGDGVGDNSDAFPNDPNEWADSDGDGVGDNSDAFPDDPNEWADSDGDGVGDNSDPDNDGDGLPDEKQTLVTTLATLDVGGDKNAQKEVEKAVKHMKKSLSPAYWQDATHLDPKEGHKVFDEDKKAVKTLSKLIKKSDAPYQESVEAVIKGVVDSEVTVVNTALAELECQDEKKCVKAKEHAEKELQKALEERSKGDSDKAIDRLKKVWRHASKAEKKAPAPQLGKQDTMASQQTEAPDVAPEIPTEFGLTGNYPNPFNPQTTIAFDIPHSAEVTLAVYDLLGRRVALLVDGVMDAGKHTVRFDARSLPSGGYIYRLTTPAGAYSRTMMLLK